MKLITFLTELCPYYGYPIVTVENAEDNHKMLKQFLSNAGKNSEDIPPRAMPDIITGEALVRLGHGEYIIYPRRKDFTCEFTAEEIVRAVSDEKFPPFAKDWLDYEILCVEPVINHEDEEDENTYLLIVVNGNNDDIQAIKEAKKECFAIRYNR